MHFIISSFGARVYDFGMGGVVFGMGGCDMMYFKHNCKEISRIPFDEIDRSVYRVLHFSVEFYRLEGEFVIWNACVIYNPRKLFSPLDKVIADCQRFAKEFDDRCFPGREDIRRRLKENPNYFLDQFRVEREDDGEFGLGGDWWKT